MSGEYQPYDSFEIKLNVDDPSLRKELKVLQRSIVRSIAIYKTPYPGQNPNRHWAFMATDKENIHVNYPILSVNDVTLNRSDNERYFVDLQKISDCELASIERGVPMHTIAAEFGGKTAQEMIDHFRALDQYTYTSSPTDPV